MNGAEALIKALIENDVDTVFGYPGGAVLPVYDAIFKNRKGWVCISNFWSGCNERYNWTN